MVCHYSVDYHRHNKCSSALCCLCKPKGTKERPLSHPCLFGFSLNLTSLISKRFVDAAKPKESWWWVKVSVACQRGLGVQLPTDQGYCLRRSRVVSEVKHTERLDQAASVPLVISLATADLLGPVCPDWVTSQQVSELREKWLVCVPLPGHTFCQAALSQAGISQSTASDAVRGTVLKGGS